jgi:hypothetical protein
MNFELCRVIVSCSHGACTCVIRVNFRSTGSSLPTVQVGLILKDLICLTFPKFVS